VFSPLPIRLQRGRAHDAPIVPLPQSFAENQFGIPTGDQLQILRVKDFVAFGFPPWRQFCP
jgi:hypothetical protein